MAISLGPFLCPAPELSLQHNLRQTPKSGCAASTSSGLDQDPQVQGGETTLSLRISSPNLYALYSVSADSIA